MILCVNGKDHELPDGLTVLGLLELRGLDPRRVAVERNKTIVRRAQFGQTALAEGDVVEIVTLVGGG